MNAAQPALRRRPEPVAQQGPGAGQLVAGQRALVAGAQVHPDHAPDAALAAHDVGREVVEGAAVAQQLAAVDDGRQRAGDRRAGQQRVHQRAAVEHLLARLREVGRDDEAGLPQVLDRGVGADAKTLQGAIVDDRDRLGVLRLHEEDEAAVLAGSRRVLLLADDGVVLGLVLGAVADVDLDAGGEVAGRGGAALHRAPLEVGVRPADRDVDVDAGPDHRLAAVELAVRVQQGLDRQVGREHLTDVIVVEKEHREPPEGSWARSGAAAASCRRSTRCARPSPSDHRRRRSCR